MNLRRLEILIPLLLALTNLVAASSSQLPIYGHLMFPDLFKRSLLLHLPLLQEFFSSLFLILLKLSCLILILFIDPLTFSDERKSKMVACHDRCKRWLLLLEIWVLWDRWWGVSRLMGHLIVHISCEATSLAALGSVFKMMVGLVHRKGLLTHGLVGKLVLLLKTNAFWLVSFNTCHLF